MLLNTMQATLARRPIIEDTGVRREYVRSVIREDMAVMNEVGKVVEVRILHTKQGVISGYFDDIELLCDEVMGYNGKHNIFFMLNPCPASPAVEMNKLHPFSKNLVGNKDILKREWLFIDIDPQRPTDTSSTDEEQAYALARAVELAEFLTANGYPAPVVANSGNGIHLLYKIDMPNDNEATAVIKVFLGALSTKFSDERLEIDTSVSNAGRLCKLYGTKSMKGEHTAERPHRLSKILYVPELLEVVTAEQLQGVTATIAPAPEPTPSQTQQHSPNPAPTGRTLDVDGFLAKHNLDVVAVNKEADRTVWRIACPFKEHEDKAAFVQQFNNGALSAGCHHDKCTWNWKDLRAKFEPAYAQAQAVRREGAEVQLPEHLAPYNELLTACKPHMHISKNGNLMILQGKEGNKYWAQLANFVPIPLEVVHEIDGTEDDIKRTSVTVGGCLSSGEELKPTSIEAERLIRGRWHLGIRAIINSEVQGGINKVSEIVQLFSQKAPERKIYEHLGFRVIDGKPCYLHSKGAIGATNVSVNLTQNNLANYEFEEIGNFTHSDRLAHVENALRVLDVHKHGNVLLAYTFLAPLCDMFKQHSIIPSFSLWLYGEPDSRKSTVASLLLNFFGKGFARGNLPMSFNDTENSMTKKLALCKDSLAVIDDVIHPAATTSQKNKQKALAQDIVFNIANRTGRGRMKADESLRKTFKPQGMVIITSELPFDNISKSTTIRLLSLEFEKDSVNLDVLTQCQHNETSLNVTLACYIEWLIANNDRLTADLHRKFENLRSELSAELGSGTSMKMVEICAYMQISLEYVLRYFLELGAIDNYTEDLAITQLKADLQRLIAKQLSAITTASPTQRFIDVVGNLFADGTVYTNGLVDPDGNKNGRTKVGWHDNHNYYFRIGDETGNIFLATKQYLSQHGIDFDIQAKDLFKRLVDEGIVTNTDKGRYSMAKTIKGKTHRVLTIPQRVFHSDTVDEYNEAQDDELYPLD